MSFVQNVSWSTENTVHWAEASDKEQGIPQHILELHALAMGKQPADFLKPSLSLAPAACFTGTPSATYNAQANIPPKYLHGAAFGDMQAYQGRFCSERVSCMLVANKKLAVSYLSAVMASRHRPEN